MSIAHRRSVTNESAIRPHENAFRSSAWSIHDGVEMQPEPMSGFRAPPMIDAAPTDRQDTMEAHLPSSFRVYTPAETRSAPLHRRSYHSIEADAGSDPASARTLLKWTGIGIVAGLCVLTALMLLLSFGDDSKRLASNSARATIGSLPEQPAVAPVAEPPAKAAEKPSAIEINASPPAKKTMTAPKKPTSKKGF